MLAPAPATAGGFNNLMNALMAQAEGLGDLAEGPALDLEPADRAMKVGARDLRCLLSVDHPGLGCASVTQQAGIKWHAV
jgi:hypothetical protein